jgi:hypothetical protein
MTTLATCPVDIRVCKARLKSVNPLALYIPCMAHSLNLVGVCAVDCCVHAVSFFGFVQSVFTFFSASTHRWSVLNECLGSHGLVVKSLSDTRWSARADAVKALSAGYMAIKTALLDIGEDDQQNGTTRLKVLMDTLETAPISLLWNVILTRYNKTSLKLQSSTYDLKLAVDLHESLHTFTDYIHNRFDEFEAKAKEVSSASDYMAFEAKAKEVSSASDYMAAVARARKRTRHFDEVEESVVVLQGRDKFRVETFLVIVNQLQTALRGRTDAYSEVRTAFKLVTEFKDLTPWPAHTAQIYSLAHFRMR